MELSRTAARPLSPEALATAVRATGRSVLTFGGYGELGYEDEGAALALCEQELRRCDPAATLVATGTLITRGYRPGIAIVYPLARALGFTTIGVHPSVALAAGDRHRLADAVDRAYFVEDATWGGCDAAGRPSNTLRALLAVTDRFVAIGGGEHTAQELRAFLAAGTPVRFHPAPMHAETARRWRARGGAAITDYRGAAERAWRDAQLAA